MSSSSRSPRSARAPEDQRLSVIAEDGDAYVPGATSTPSASPRSTHRPFARRWKDSPPRASSELKPPEYSTIDESRQKRDRLAELMGKPAVARRGGWRRLLVMIVLTLVIIAVALGVGLGVGLTRQRSSASSSAGGSTSRSNGTDQGFPVGRYAIGAFLETVDTSCTSDSATFRCYPYSTYSSSQSASTISFNWIVSGSKSQYAISSSDNPFAITFSNVSLQLTDVGSPDERYTFSTIMDKVVIPSSPITGDNAQAECFFNGTVLSGALYTRREVSGAAKKSNSSDGQALWQPWPFAAQLNQTKAGGPNVPDCYELNNGAPVSQITTGLIAEATDTTCGCFYRNFNL